MYKCYPKNIVCVRLHNTLCKLLLLSLLQAACCGLQLEWTMQILPSFGCPLLLNWIGRYRLVEILPSFWCLGICSMLKTGLCCWCFDLSILVHTVPTVTTLSCLTVFFNWKGWYQLVQILSSFCCPLLQVAWLVYIIWSVVIIDWKGQWCNFDQQMLQLLISFFCIRLRPCNGMSTRMSTNVFLVRPTIYFFCICRNWHQCYWFCRHPCNELLSTRRSTNVFLVRPTRRRQLDCLPLIQSLKGWLSAMVRVMGLKLLIYCWQFIPDMCCLCVGLYTWPRLVYEDKWGWDGTACGTTLLTSARVRRVDDGHYLHPTSDVSFLTGTCNGWGNMLCWSTSA